MPVNAIDFSDLTGDKSKSQAPKQTANPTGMGYPVQNTQSG